MNKSLNTVKQAPLVFRRHKTLWRAERAGPRFRSREHSAVKKDWATHDNDFINVAILPTSMGVIIHYVRGSHFNKIGRPDQPVSIEGFGALGESICYGSGRLSRSQGARANFAIQWDFWMALLESRLIRISVDLCKPVDLNDIPSLSFYSSKAISWNNHLPMDHTFVAMEPHLGAIFTFGQNHPGPFSARAYPPADNQLLN